MLVLTRKNGESLVIGDNVVITILETQKGRCKIGITAPKDVKVLRLELDPRRNNLPTTEPKRTPSGLWRCENCGEGSVWGDDSSWRWAGDRMQHKCAGAIPQAGYFDCRWFGDGPPPQLSRNNLPTTEPVPVEGQS